MLTPCITFPASVNIVVKAKASTRGKNHMLHKVQTKFKMGDLVEPIDPPKDVCPTCGQKEKEKRDESFEVEEITIKLYDYRPPVVTYHGDFLSGYYEEGELKLSKKHK